MQQEDYLKRQFDQLGYVLAKILSDLMGLKTKGPSGERIEIADRELTETLQLSIEDLASIPEETFINTVKEKGRLTDGSLEILADLLFNLAENADEEYISCDTKRQLYRRSLILCEYLDSTGSTFSFKRHIITEKLKTYPDI